MNELGDYMNNLQKSQGGGDTSQQMFSMMDELSSNFKEEFQAAKESSDSKEKVSSKEKKDPSQENETSQVSEEEKLERAEAAKKKLLEQEEGVKENLQKKLTKKEEAPQSEGKSEEETSQIEDNKESPEAAAIQAEATKVEDTSAKDSSEKVAKPAAAKEDPSIGNEKELKAQEKLENGKGAQADAAKEQKPQVEIARPAPQQEEVADIDGAKPEPKRNVPTFAESLKEEAPPLIDPKELEKVMHGLKKVSELSQVQPPMGEKVSARILESLKSTNQQLARQISSTGGKMEVANAQYNRQGQRAGSAAEQPKDAEAPQRSRMEEKLEKMKAKVLDQIRVKIKTLSTKKGGSIKIQLRPQWLGNVKVQINFEDTTASGNLLVENNTVKEMLQRSLPQLQKALAEHGIEADNINIDVDENLQGDGENGRSFHSAEDQKAARQWVGSFTNFGEAAVRDDEEIEAAPEAEGDAEQVLNVVV